MSKQNLNVLVIGGCDCKKIDRKNEKRITVKPPSNDHLSTRTKQIPKHPNQY